jgi:uncharacterized protein YegL
VVDERVGERVAHEEGAVTMPFYVICDVSWSMKGSMDALNEALVGLRQAIITEPVVDDVARICIIAFSDSADVVMPLSQVSDRVVPTLGLGTGTNYGAAFRLLAQTISADIADLKQQGMRVFRPCAFFLTDGEPGDHDWHETFTAALRYDPQTQTGMKQYPIFVPFGFGEASRDVLKRLAYPPDKGKWYLSHDTSPTGAIKGLLDILMKTVVTGGLTGNSDKPAVIPAAPASNSDVEQGSGEDDWM